MEYRYKISLVGRSGVGKSSTVTRIAQDRFDDNQESTIGASFLSKRINLDARHPPFAINFEFWDTAGQERYHSLIPMYTRGANIILLCTDNPDVSRLVEDFKIYKLDTISATVLVIVTKIDDPNFNPDQYKAMKNYCADMDYAIYFTSSKTGDGIEDLIEAIKEACLKQDPIQRPAVRVLHKDDKKPESKCCDNF